MFQRRDVRGEEMNHRVIFQSLQVPEDNMSVGRDGIARISMNVLDRRRLDEASAILQ